MLRVKYYKNVSAAVREAVSRFLKDDEEAKRQRLQELQVEIAVIEDELRAIDEIKEVEAERHQEMLIATEPIRQSIEYQGLVKRTVAAIKFNYGDMETSESKRFKLLDVEFIAKKFVISTEIVRGDIEEGLNKHTE
jgi:Arc/MetJ-type ribon-helix-helix transcriptional regulator